MALQTIVNANIVIAGPAPAPQPLDVPILGVTLTGPQGTNWDALYGSNLIVEVAADTWPDVLAGIGITDGEAAYEWLQLCYAQTPSPRLVQLGRRAAPVAQVTNFDLGDAGAATDGNYTITLNGSTFTHPASGESRAQVVTALLALLPGTEPVADAPGADAEQIDVTANEAGVPFTFAASAPAPDAWTITPTTPNAGLVTDVVLWEAERQTRSLDPFYLVTQPEAVTEGLAKAAGDTAPSFPRDITYQLRTDSVTDPNAETGGGIADTLSAFNYERLVLYYVPTATDQHPAAIIGKRITTEPGSTSWGNVQLTNMVAPLNSSTVDNVLIGAPYAYFDRIESLGPSISISRNVRVLSGNRYDVIRGADYLKASVIADVFALLLREDKIPFTREGYLTIGNTIDATCDRFVKTGFIAGVRPDGSPGYSVTIPDLPPPGDADRDAGIARGFAFDALLAGSIERVFPIDGLLIQ